MAWWDHEELKEMKMRSDRYILTFYEEYETIPEMVRNAAFRAIQKPRIYNDNVRFEYVTKLLSYGLKNGEKPKFRVPYVKSQKINNFNRH